MNNLLKGCLVAASLVLGNISAHAGKDGGTLSFLVQPEPPTLASYVSTSGPIGLVMPKVYEGLFDYDNDGNPVWVGTPVVWTFESKDALIEHLLDVVHDGTGVKLEYRTTADGSVFARYSV